MALAVCAGLALVGTGLLGTAWLFIVPAAIAVAHVAYVAQAPARRADAGGRRNTAGAAPPVAVDAIETPEINVPDDAPPPEPLTTAETAEEPQTRGGQRKTKDEEIALLKRVKARDPAATQTLIEAKRGLVLSVAQSYTRRGLQLSELIDEGTLGLIRAVHQYDYRRPGDFSVYAQWWIHAAIHRAVSETGHTFNVPTDLLKRLDDVVHAEARLRQQLSRDPTVAETAAELGTSAEEIEEIRRVVQEGWIAG
jgi:RNA polymerase sigma factor (sigma-70 family)